MQYILLAFFDKLCNFQQPTLPKELGSNGDLQGDLGYKISLDDLQS